MVEEMRVNYRDGGRIKISNNNMPLELLINWIEEARTKKLIEANAICLSTIDDNGNPQSRMVLVKYINNFEIGFFTNLGSNKANEINANKNVSGVMFWPEMERQVRITGIASLMPRDKVSDYHRSRPRESQIAAFTSMQSRPLKSLDHLIKEFHDTELEFKDKEIPLPEHWGGYVIKISSIEYWSGRPSRLHERIVLKIQGSEWSERRLYP
ncbi:MAG: pyridoxamine 5'-phosphate oxidase [Euryarchaeota archaeon]|jgi:pyridoxamine 5'-phosphate oxidase|nr:pyridoxamine 5'-phosphate oxidase [Euryarchaeota archaeon]MBT4392323.1 pyridoxamine 5'-phosphate oxidase [Euryarchaeota archaeon]MBT4803163.1 pyridoxamine 5'-phosphate oxidase [Euryarchaeota archaeon]MBT6684537.1 pyridoxamine 5'-phosphate oxidase [Euryarchaeota archaeon]MBT6874032.1 pyridoxamine 5'-phosphate oxidase [Euryarchaeota archaeon]